MSEVYEAMKSRLVEGFVKEAGVTQAQAESMAHEIALTFDELEKSAMNYQAFRTAIGNAVAQNSADFMSSAARALGAAAVAGLTGAAYLGASKAGGAVSNNMNYRAFRTAVDKAVAQNSMLQRADRAKIDRVAETIFKYAPTAAADPHLLGSILSEAVHMESVDIQTIKMLVDLEKVHSGINEPKNTLASLLRG